MQIEMTGLQDKQGAWKFAMVGQPGAGKTLFASTAKDPLFVLFQQEPRIKSIADRAIPHVKITNDYDTGVMATDTLTVLVDYLYFEDHDYKTLVIDTGDELFQAMKAGRTHENGGEFGPGDWGWIADAYRQLMLRIIDLPMDIIVNYHVKTTQDDEQTFKELMLQGAAKDEAAGWFDIVGAFDTFELVDESGTPVTKRAIMTSPSRSYPFLKDHSNALPHRFEVSQGFADDFPRMLSVVSSDLPSVEHEVLAEISPRVPMPTISTSGVPSPEDLDAKKKESPEPLPTAEPASAPIDTASTSEPLAGGTATEQTTSKTDDHINQEQSAATASAADMVQAVTPEVVSSDSEQQVESAEGEALAVVQEVLGGEQIFECEVCGIPVEDEAVRDLTQIRFRKYLCKPHFNEALKER